MLKHLKAIIPLLVFFYVVTGCAEPYYGLNKYFPAPETKPFDHIENVYIFRTTLHSEDSELQDITVPEIYGMQKGAYLFNVLDLDTFEIYSQIQTTFPTGHVSAKGTYSPQANAYYYLTNGKRGLFKIEPDSGEISDLISLPIPPMDMTMTCTPEGYIIVYDTVINREEGKAMLIFDTKTDTVVGDIIYYHVGPYLL